MRACAQWRQLRTRRSRMGVYRSRLIPRAMATQPLDILAGSEGFLTSSCLCGCGQRRGAGNATHKRVSVAPSCCFACPESLMLDKPRRSLANERACLQSARKSDRRQRRHSGFWRVCLLASGLWGSGRQHSIGFHLLITCHRGFARIDVLDSPQHPVDDCPPIPCFVSRGRPNHSKKDVVEA